MFSPWGVSSSCMRKGATLLCVAMDAGRKLKNRVLLCRAARCRRWIRFVGAVSNQHSKAALVLCCRIFSAAQSVLSVLSGRTQNMCCVAGSHCCRHSEEGVWGGLSKMMFRSSCKASKPGFKSCISQDPVRVDRISIRVPVGHPCPGSWASRSE